METDTRLVGGRYRLLSQLGQGGMGTVWRAEDVLLGRAVAVKEVLLPHGISDAERDVVRERTRREARLAARLSSPHAVTVYDVVEEGGSPFVVMELVQARTLSQVVREDGPLSPAQVADVGLAVLDALAAAHAQGIVHRDVKPGNVLVQDDGRVVLSDFGIARSSADPSITSTGLLLGSPSYIAPELARGEQPGPAVDLWGLGATLFTAVEGRPPFDGPTPLATVTAVVNGEHAPFTAAGPLAAVLDGLLDKDPTTRVDAAGALAKLRQVKAAAPHAAATPEPAPDPSAEERSGATTALPLAAAAAAAAGGVAAGTADDRAAEPEPRPEPEPEPEPVAFAGGPSRDTPPPSLDQPSSTRVPRVPATRAAPPAPAKRRSKAPVAVGLAVLLALGGVGAALLSGDDPSAPRTATAPTPAASAAPSAGSDEESGTSEDSPSTDSGADSGAGSGAGSGEGQATNASSNVPAGWTRYSDESEGWSVAHPPGWTVSSRNGLRQFRDPSTGRTLRIDHAAQAKGDPVADWRAQSASFRSRFPSYQEIKIEGRDYRTWRAADWEFTFSDGGTALHVLNRNLIVGREAYALYWQTPERSWPGSVEVYEQIASTFKPGPQGPQ